jgi:hypothetical protein
VIFFSQREIFQAVVVEKIKTRLYAVAFLSKIVQFVIKCGKALLSPTNQRWQFNHAHALCMLGD